MMDQLGIKALRPGPSGTETAPNHANYDEATANPYPNLPDVLTLKNGRKVTTPAMWEQRRKEIIEDFDREVLGRVPANAPKVTWTVTRTADATVGGRAVVGKQFVGHVDNSSFPAIDVDIQMTLVTPKDADGPVPVMIMFGGGRGLPGDPPPAGFGGLEDDGARRRRLPAESRRRQYQARPRTWPRGGRRTAERRAGDRARAAGAPGFGPPAGGDPPATEQLIADGWGYASLNPTSVQADNGAGLTRGIIGLVNKGQAAQAGGLGLAAGVGLGRVARPRLSRNGQDGGREARRHRGRVALRQGRADHDGV